MVPNILDNYSAATQADMRQNMLQLKQQKAITHVSVTSGTGARGAAGRQAGLEIPFKTGVPHGDVALNSIAGVTSFERASYPRSEKMYVGLAETGFTVENEFFQMKDENAGHQPESKADRKRDIMRTYAQHRNWYAIGVNTGSLAVVTVGGGSGNITLANDNTARGRSKGALRLAISEFTTVGKRIMYQSYNPSTDALTATFYITARPSTTQVTIVVTDAGTVVAGDVVVKFGHYKRVPYGFGYHINHTPRSYQGANTAVHTFLNSRMVDGGNALINPTVISTAKGAMAVRANDMEARKNRICRMNVGNWRLLCDFGYDLRQYNAEKGQADTTYGHPWAYMDEDTIFPIDADFEDAYVYMHDRTSYFNYTQLELTEVGNEERWIGTNERGSTEFYQNWAEAKNLAWDGRGDDGKGSGNGAPNSSVVIQNLALPTLTQVAEGQFLV